MNWKIRRTDKGGLSIQDEDTGEMLYASDPPGVCPLSEENARLLERAVQNLTRPRVKSGVRTAGK